MNENDMTRHQRKHKGFEVLEVNDLQFGVHKRQGEHIVGKKVEIGTGEFCDSFHGATFEDCEIRIRCSGRCTVTATSNCSFIRCTVWAHKIQRIPTWNASFHGCAFKGKYETRFSGTVEDCDFTQSTLNSVVFLQESGLGNTLWPDWPHIIIDDVRSNYEEWKGIPKPKNLGRFLFKLRGIAAVINLEMAAENPEEVWKALRDHDFIRSNRPN